MTKTQQELRMGYKSGCIYVDYTDVCTDVDYRDVYTDVDYTDVCTNIKYTQDVCKHSQEHHACPLSTTV